MPPHPHPPDAFPVARTAGLAPKLALQPVARAAPMPNARALLSSSTLSAAIEGGVYKLFIQLKYPCPPPCRGHMTHHARTNCSAFWRKSPCGRLQTACEALDEAWRDACRRCRLGCGWPPRWLTSVRAAGARPMAWQLPQRGHRRHQDRRQLDASAAARPQDHGHFIF